MFFSSSRSPIQCLNPLQLQKPEEGCGLADAELGNVGARIGGKEEENQRALHRTFRYGLVGLIFIFMQQAEIKYVSLFELKGVKFSY